MHGLRGYNNNVGLVEGRKAATVCVREERERVGSKRPLVALLMVLGKRGRGEEGRGKREEGGEQEEEKVEGSVRVLTCVNRLYRPLFASAAAVPRPNTRMLCPDLRVPSSPKLREPGILLAAEVTIMFFDSVCKNRLVRLEVIRSATLPVANMLGNQAFEYFAGQNSRTCRVQRDDLRGARAWMLGLPR